MGAAARAGLELGVTPAELVDRQDQLLASLDLPLQAGLPVTPGQVLGHMARDKKARDGAVPWVLLEALGRASAGHAVASDVAEHAVRWALGG